MFVSSLLIVARDARTHDCMEALIKEERPERVKYNFVAV